MSKQKNLLANSTRGALTRHGAGKEPSWLLLSVLPLRTDFFRTRRGRTPKYPCGSRAPQRHWRSAAPWPWASHLISLCRGLHGYKMRIIVFADSTSHCQLSQYVGIFPRSYVFLESCNYRTIRDFFQEKQLHLSPFCSIWKAGKTEY